MPLPLSPLSRICQSIYTFLAAGLKVEQRPIRVTIGSPAAAAPAAGEANHRVNLFFYLIEPAGFGPGADPDEVWLLRLHCLITTFGIKEDLVSPGENDLRLLGEVLRLFHETPVLPPLDLNGAGGGPTVRMQAIFSPLSLDQINHIWSTQGDVPYRPSVAYEMSLVPVVPSKLSAGSPLAGAVGFGVEADGAARWSPFKGQVMAPAAAARTVDTRRPDWAPRICLVQDGACRESLALELGSDELQGFEPQVWIAGKAGSGVKLRWEAWDATQGWRQLSGEVDAQAAGATLDPAQAGTAATLAVPLPFKDKEGQLVLYAVRPAAPGTPGAGPATEVRSNPLLLSLYEGGA